MKLLVITDYYLPHWTGISKSLSYFLNTLKDRHDVTVITIQHAPHLSPHEVIDGIPVVRFPYSLSLSRAKISFLFWFRTLPYLSKADTVFINSPSAHIFPLSLLVKLFGKRLVIFHQGDLLLPKGFTNRLIENVFDMATIFACSLADKVATFTDDYAQHSRVLKHFLYKCISFQPHLPEEKETKKNEHLKKLRKSQSVVFGFAGRFVEEKGFDILYEAIPEVIDQLPEAYFVYAGETKLGYEHFYESNRDRFKRIRKHVTELGLLSEPELTAFYKGIDFIVIPSRSDCYNLVQARAMSLGVPSVVSNIPGARYLVKESGFGYIFTSEDPHDLAMKLIEANKNRKTLEKKYAKLKTIINSKDNEKKLDEFIG